MPKLITIFFLIILFLLIVLPRTLDLDSFQTADEKRWLANTTNFITNLAHGDWSHLMQQPHPGITTQWIASPTAFSDSWAIRKLPLVLAQSILLLLTSYIFWRLTNSKTTTFFITLFLAISPPLIAHTRVYAMDSLLSHFLIISIGLLLLWRHSKSRHYLFFSAFSAAAAILSKISGIIIVPFILGIIIIWLFKDRQEEKNSASNYKILFIWFGSFLLSLVIILPSLALNTKEVITDILSWLQSDDYLLHQIGPSYYLRTLLFFSTPLHLFSLFTVPVFLISKKIPAHLRTLLLIFLIFAILFTIQMSLGSKKGDRYILPSLLCLDIIAALIISYVFSLKSQSLTLLIAKLSLLTLVVLQIGSLITLHPYYLSYVNPITQPFFDERRLGWGEGLDLAAKYLNELPDSASLTVASYYPNEFANYFNGHSVPAHEHNHANVDYVIIYRAMFERDEDAWETDVINTYRPQTPIKTIFIDHTPMIWIYQVEK